jgi:hypothetical protein
MAFGSDGTRPEEKWLLQNYSGWFRAEPMAERDNKGMRAQSELNH